MTKKYSGVYMRLKDPKALARLITIKGVSNRQAAFAAGWKSHSYMHRLLQGKAKSCRPEAALRLAEFLEVEVGDIFLTQLSGQSEHYVKDREQNESSYEPA